MAKKKTTRKATSRKTSGRKTAAKGAGRKSGSKASAAGRKTTSRKAAASKAGRKTTARKTAAKKASARKTTARKTTAKKTSARKTAARKTTAKKTAARKTAPRKTASKGAATAKAGPGRTGGRAAAAKAPKAAVRRPTKAPYTKSQLKPMREALLIRRARLLRDLNLMGDEALREGDREIDSESVADHGTDAYERNLTLGLMEADSRALRQVDVALDAMDGGSYGLCEECGEAIPLARLEALPFAITCIACQQRAEGYR